MIPMNDKQQLQYYGPQPLYPTEKTAHDLYFLVHLAYSAEEGKVESDQPLSSVPKSSYIAPTLCHMTLKQELQLLRAPAGGKLDIFPKFSVLLLALCT